MINKTVRTLEIFMNLYGKENLNYLGNVDNYEHNSERKRFESIMKENFLCGNVRWTFFVLLEP